MKSVTDIVKVVSQPVKGYLPISNFEVKELGGDILQCDIQPILIGKCVDSVLRLIVNTEPEVVFRSSVIGYENRVQYFANSFSYCGNTEVVSKEIRDEDGKFNVYSLISRIKPLIESYDIYRLFIVVLTIHQYDIWEYDYYYISSRSTIDSSRPKYYKKSDIRVLVEMYKRLLSWLCTMLEKGVIFDYKFYPDGYTDKVKYGVGDFVCANTLFDLKCIKGEPNKRHTLQLLMYYIMGIHSNNKLYKNVRYLGIYSPITNKVWSIDINTIPKELINKVGCEVIGYNEPFI